MVAVCGRLSNLALSHLRRKTVYLETLLGLPPSLLCNMSCIDPLPQCSTNVGDVARPGSGISLWREKAKRPEYLDYEKEPCYDVRVTISQYKPFAI
jgi:hypothetical protein